MSHIEQILAALERKDITLQEAKERLETDREQTLGFAHADIDRQSRRGRAETIYCENKTSEQIIGIAKIFIDHQQNVLMTRLDLETFEEIDEAFPDPNWEYNEMARCARLIVSPAKRKSGTVAVLTGGTTDLPVAEEAAFVADTFGSSVERFFDVGVAGVHRLTSKIDKIRQSKVYIAVAGMEGALPSVLAGLVKGPVIAVPTSVGYGSNFQGLSALLTMLNSCAPGIATVNIDNGFGAGYLADQMLELAQNNE